MENNCEICGGNQELGHGDFCSEKQEEADEENEA